MVTVVGRVRAASCESIVGTGRLEGPGLHLLTTVYRLLVLAEGRSSMYLRLS